MTPIDVRKNFAPNGPFSFFADETLIHVRKKRFLLCAVWLIFSSISLYAQQSVTLETCRRMALEQNKKIGMARTEREEAARVRKSMRTQYLPKIDFAGGWLRTGNTLKLLENDLFLPVVPFNAIDPQTMTLNPEALSDPATAMSTFVINPQTGKPLTDAMGTPLFKNYAMLPADKFVIDRKNLCYAGFHLRQPVFTGCKIVEANRMAAGAERIAREKVKLTQAEVLAETDAAYWRVVSLQEKVKLAQAYEQLLDRLVTDLENMYAEGIITRNDLLKAQVRQNDAKLKRLKAENGSALSKMALAQIIGIGGEDIKVDEGAMEEVRTLASASFLENVSPDDRAEISMLKEKISIMESGKNIARSKFMPNILLTGGYGWLNPNPYGGLKKEFGGDWSVGIAVTIPVFTWGERVHDLRVAKYEKQKAELELEQAREMIDLQIHQNRYKYTEALKRVELTGLSKKQAEENMRLAKDNLLEGRIRLAELLEAQVQWENAASEYIDARVEVCTALSELEKSTGAIYRSIE